MSTGRVTHDMETFGKGESVSNKAEGFLHLTDDGAHWDTGINQVLKSLLKIKCLIQNFNKTN